VVVSGERGSAELSELEELADTVVGIALDLDFW